MQTIKLYLHNSKKRTFKIVKLVIQKQPLRGVLKISVLTQLTFTCSKSTTKILEKGVKYFQS